MPSTCYRLAGLDLRSRPLVQRRVLLREMMPKLPKPIRHSETFDVPPADLLKAVREHGLQASLRNEGTLHIDQAIALRVKLRANRRKEVVLGGFVPASGTFDSILVG